MAPSGLSSSLWAKDTMSENVEVECLMPNSIIIAFTVDREITLLDLKEELWEEAQKHPLYGVLRDKQSYIFMCVNCQSEQEELVDEMRKLCDIQPFQFILKVVERKGDKAEKLLNAQIGLLIGKGLHEFDALKNTEVNEFRWQMRAVCEDFARERDTLTWKEKTLYKHPVRLASSPDLPMRLRSNLKEDNISVLVRFENIETSFTFRIPYLSSPRQLLQMVLAKKAHISGTEEESVDDYCLKVCGQEEYLLAEKPLSQYKYIQSMISKYRNPQLVTVSLQGVLHIVDGDSVYFNLDEIKSRRSRSGYSTMTLGGRKKPKFVWSSTIAEPFSFKVCDIRRLNCSGSEVAIQAGLFIGGESLCEARKTREVQSTDGDTPFDEDLCFDIEVRNIPRIARLCLVVYEISKNAKGPKHRKSKGGNKQDSFINALAWVNTTVYDFKNHLKSGSVTLYMWTYAEDMQNDDLLHPLGTVVSNPSVEHSTALTITFVKYKAEYNIVYPTINKLCEDARQDMNPDVTSNSSTHASKAYLEQLRQICDRDPLHQLHEQDKELMWFLRKDCLAHLPHSLPKLLQCLKWNEYKCIAEMMDLLQSWPKLSPEQGLELLDYAYADQEIRKFAVNCLKDISDEDLLLYLLQLVQALKHESYLYSDLVEFLLGRALKNQNIGHYFFWHLRSEMHVPAVSIRFGLILEAYCLGSVEHMRTLSRQIDALGKLKFINEMILQKREPRDKVRQIMFEVLNKSSFMDALCGLRNPLDPSIKCKNLKVEKCKFMDSKMKPLWLVFHNEDIHGEPIYVIFKNGDDLRQDMLTLQMIRIMDKLWKDEGLDLRMNPYGCISTDHKVGLIEVVLNANTIANIQKEKGIFTATSTFKKGSLLGWLRDHNVDEKSLNQAVEEFTLSCAGYCVATYVLGIADRHNDNIMVKTNGQLFHIDFGHILGNFKEKFGIRRERVPFVLTNDFVYVITKGQNQKSQEFSRFQSYCEKAFGILRRKGSLIISLFAMMLSTGIPELSCENDLAYLRETLVLDLPEPEALKHFRSKFDEALKNSWKTSVNWLAHNLSKDNKMND